MQGRFPTFDPYLFQNIFVPMLVWLELKGDAYILVFIKSRANIEATPTPKIIAYSAIKIRAILCRGNKDFLQRNCLTEV